MIPFRTLSILLATAWLLPALRGATIYYVTALSGSNFNTADAPLISRLTEQGHEVLTVNDAVGTPAGALSAGADAILLSAGMSLPPSVQFREVALPLLLWRIASYNSLGFTGPGSGTNFGSQTGQSQLAITNAAHPLAAGLSGSPVVVTSAQTFSWGVPAAGATPIATLSGNATRAVIFAYETGAAMSGLNAPARRIAFFPGAAAAAAFNDDAYALFDAAVAWMVGPPPGIPVRPRRESPGPSTRRTDLVISEIHYHPATRLDGRNHEFVEVYNSSPFTVDLSGFALGGEVQYTFADGVSLPGFGYLVVAKVPADVSASYGLSGVLGPYSGNLPNAGGVVLLEHRNGAVLLEAVYDDETPWPAAADGAGHSLVLARPSYGERGDPRAWEASTWIDGSPGTADPGVDDALDDLVINEVLANTEPPQEDFLELYNHGTRTLDLAGVQIADSLTGPRFVLPPATTLSPGGFLYFTASQLGFAFSSAGESIYLWNAATNRVLDALALGPTAGGVSWGRVPDGADEGVETSAPTPGASNASEMPRPIVINEIMYNPLTGNSDDEYLELYNRGTNPVSVAGWQIAGGITFTFPPGATIAPDGYAVVVRNAARFLSRYPLVDPAGVYGNYTGSLANSGERLLLLEPADPLDPALNLVRVDMVDYRDGGSWGGWSDGGGSSLELIDPWADNRLGPNWADSDETAKADWTTVTATGLLNFGRTTAAADEIGFLAIGDGGEWLVDKVTVSRSTDAPGVNRVPNGDFETNVAGWAFRGNHFSSVHHPGEGADGSAASLRVIATGDGDTGANLVEADLSPALANGDTATLSARVRWLRGSTNVLLRLYNNYLEAPGGLEVPSHLGTPGTVNSRRIANAGPALTDVRHQPVLPTAGQRIFVTARAHDPQGVAAVALHYRLDPATNLFTVALNDSGQSGDLAAGDGIWSGSIPGQSAATRVAFHLAASDAHGSPASTRFPATPGREALVRVGEQPFHANFKTTRIWLTDANRTAWINRAKLSNALIDCTVVHGDERVIYEAGARYRGSPFIRPSFAAPDSGSPNLVFNTPKDDRLLNSASFNLDSMEPNKDNTAQRERMAFWMIERLGGVVSHQRYIHTVVQGNRLATVYTDVQAPNGDFLESWYPGADDGDFFEIDDWFEFGDDSLMQGNVNATLQVFATAGVKKQARYRWNWEKKSQSRDGDSYQSIFDLVDVMNAPATQYVAQVQQHVDVDRWWLNIAMRRACGDWDGYGYARGKNTYIYRPPGGRWQLLPWDMDFSLGAGSRATNQDLFAEINDPTLNAFYTTAPFRRAYFGMLKDICLGPMTPAAFNARSDHLHAVLANSGLGGTVTAPTVAMQAWASDRRTYILGQLAPLAAPFLITSNGGLDFSTDTAPATLSGTAPVECADILLNGLPLAATWTTVTNWTVSVPLVNGFNAITLTTRDRQGHLLPAFSDSIGITYSGGGLPLAGNLKITEVFYNPPAFADFAGNTLEFLEIKSVAAGPLDLSGASFSGVTYTFPPGSTLDPGQHLVLASNATHLQAKYPWVTVFDSYTGQLDNAGEWIQLLDSQNNLVAEIAYDDNAPWPTAPDGGGYSLVPTQPNPTGGQNEVGLWRVSTQVGGSPGEDDPEPTLSLPIVLVQPADVTGTVGQAATFFCRVRGYPSPDMIWQRDGVDLPGQNWLTLLTAPVVALDQGAQFQLRASNSQGAVASRLATLHLPAGAQTPAAPDVALTSGAAALIVPTESGMLYRIQTAESLENPVWRNLGPAFSGDGTAQTVAFPPSEAARLYLRVLAWSTP
jgi:hypothetical protein